MMNFWCIVILVLCPVLSAENSVELCANRVFKCINATSLRICFNGQLVSTEFMCPHSTYCSETSDKICTNIADYDYADYLEETEDKLKPETNPDLKCTQEGAFPIENSGCKKYYKCIKKPTGFLIKQLTCYSGYFDPISQNCSASYICPDIPENCPLEIPQCTTSGKFPIPNADCKKYVLCKQTSNGWEPQVKDCFTASSFNPTIGRCDKNYICTETTKNPESCISTPETNGTDITTTDITNSTVTDTTTKDSTITDTTTDKSIISTVPISPTENTYSTTKESTITETSITDTTIRDSTIADTTTDEAPKTKPTAYESTITDSTTRESTITYSSTTDSTTISVQECTQSGKFLIPNSGCKQYLLCTVTTHGFLQQIFECPLNSFFDPDTQKCKVNYICREKPFIITTTEISPTTISEELNTTEEPSTSSTESSIHNSCIKQGKFPVGNTNCTKYLHCLLTTNGFLEQILECTIGTMFDPQLKKCSESYICSESTEEETDTSTPSNGVCKQQGKILIENSSCKKYISCILTSNGFEATDFECPNGSLFDSQLQKCSTSYTCTELPSNIQNMTTIEYTPNCEGTTELISTVSQLPTCLLEGRLEIPGTNCKKYLLCVGTQKGFVSSVYSCPAGSFFNPVKKRCSEIYACDEDIKICTTIGRFPSPVDNSCKFYYECAEEDINYIKGIQKECGDGYYFNPEIQQCTTNYICPNNFYRKTTLSKIISPRFLVNGQCTTVGRYLVQLSNCKNYVYCSANTDGTLKATQFTCPTTTVFNQAIQKCASPSSYTCPDSLCVNNPGFNSWLNPNVKDCSSYIICQPIYNNLGMLLGFTGVITYCQPGTLYNPMLQICDPNPMYVCSTNNRNINWMVERA